MLLSIVIPVYNVENNLRKCVESILKQMDEQMELILVDDGSQDKSGKICDRLSLMDPRIKVIHQSNQGALHARRVGIQAAKGSYIMIPDSDDYIADNAVNEITAVIDKYSPDMICFDWYRVDEKTKARSYISQLPVMETKSIVQVDIDLVREAIARYNTAGTLNTKVVKKNLIDINVDYGIYGKSISTCDDLFQVLPILDACKMVVYIPKPLYWYQKTEGSISTSYRLDKINSYAIVMKRREEYLNKWKISDVLRNTSRERTLGAVLFLLRRAFEESYNEGKKATDCICNSEIIRYAYERVKCSTRVKKIRITFPLIFRKKYRMVSLFVRKI